MGFKIESVHRTTFPLDGTEVPVLIRRLNKGQMRECSEALEREFTSADVSMNDKLEFACSQIVRYVSFAPGAVTVGDDERPIETGSQIVEELGGRQDVVIGLFTLIGLENRGLSGDQKKVFKSLAGSALGLPAWTPSPDGDKPGPTAGNVVPFATAGNGDATAPSNGASSGTTETSSFEPVLSEA